MEIICNKMTGPEWDSFVEEKEGSNMAHLYGWKEVIENSYGHKTYYFHVYDKDRVLALLPMVFIESRIFGRQLVSMPFLDYGGICAAPEDRGKELLDETLESLKAFSKELNAECVDLRHLSDLNCGWERKLEKVTMIMGLEASEDEMWKKLSSERRNRIRKAVKNDLSTSFAGPEAIDEFYDIFAENMRDLGSPVHSKRFFRNIMRVFDERTRIILVKQGTKTIGAALCFLFKGTISIPWVSSLRSHFALYPNNILYWDAMKYAIEHGCCTFDFGRSSKGSGTYQFKKRWGAKPVQLFWDYYDEKGGETSKHSIDNSRKYEAALKIWQQMPVQLTRLIGPLLRKNISN